MTPEKLFWLASYPKSGNTWIRLLLAAYKLGALDINANAGATEYDCSLYLYNALSPYPITELEPETTVYLRHAVLLHLMFAKRSNPGIVKTHCGRYKAGDVDLIPTEMTQGAVYVVRDPRDVCVSFARHMGMTVDQAITAMNEPGNKIQNAEGGIASWVGTWSGHVRSWDKGGVTRIRFEDLKENPEREFERVLSAFRIRLNRPRLKKAVRLCRLERLRYQESKAGFVERGRHPQFFGVGRGWQVELTDRQANRIEADHGETMKALGYL